MQSQAGGQPLTSAEDTHRPADQLPFSFVSSLLNEPNI